MDLAYLDNNATTRPAPQVVEAMNEAQTAFWANPSSVHRPGQVARQKVELARASVASLIGTHPRQIVFTSGGTESNNLAIGGTLDESPTGVLITSRIEHSAIREPAQVFGKKGSLVWLPILPGGRIDPDSVSDAVLNHADSPGPILVSVQWANNETGVIQPIQEIASLLAELRTRFRQDQAQRPAVYFHVDACQAVGKIPVDVEAAGIDLLSLSGHKFHGPKGVGALYVRRGIKLKRQIHGGPQELQRRGGTENTPGIIGLGVAAELARTFVQDREAINRLAALRDRFESQVLRLIPGSRINGPDTPEQRLWNTTNLAFPSLEAEAILLGLSERGVCASAGAACSSGSLEPSPVLLAMGVPEPVAHGSVRFSFSRDTRESEVETALQVLPQVVARLGRVMPVG